MAYVAATGGEYTFRPSSGHWHSIHTFTTSGTFTVTEGGTVEYLIIGGGGGGGSDMGGGGGAGGYLAGSTTLTAGTYNIVIGAGGSGAPAGNGQVRGSNGEDTVAIGLTAYGGGGGASQHNGAGAPAGNGGSGGGGSGGRLAGASYGGLPGNGTPGQGNDGATSGTQWYPGGGGGAGAAAVQTGSLVAHGGIGIENNILGTSYYWAAGGGGGGYTTYGGDGGLGGGGGGAPRGGTTGLGGGSALNSGSDAEIGTTSAQTNKRGGNAGENTGSGGGGGSHYNLTNNGGDGGSGIVIIKYMTQPPIIGFDQSGSDLTIILNSIGGETPGASQPNGTVVPYTISGNYITEDKIGNPLTGNFVLTDNTDEITISIGSIPSTTLTFTAFGETGTYDIVFPATLVGDVTELNSINYMSDDFMFGSPESILNGIGVVNFDDIFDPNLISNLTILTPSNESQLANPPEMIRFVTQQTGGLTNMFTINPLGAEIIKEIWY